MTDNCPSGFFGQLCAYTTNVPSRMRPLNLVEVILPCISQRTGQSSSQRSPTRFQVSSTKFIFTIRESSLSKVGLQSPPSFRSKTSSGSPNSSGRGKNNFQSSTAFVLPSPTFLLKRSRPKLTGFSPATELELSQTARLQFSSDSSHTRCQRSCTRILKPRHRIISSNRLLAARSIRTHSIRASLG
jgi:hypothetical protein